MQRKGKDESVKKQFLKKEKKRAVLCETFRFHAAHISILLPTHVFANLQEIVAEG